jgi:TRAP-type C4-dicarboxylate transport system permease small subunit
MALLPVLVVLALAGAVGGIVALGRRAAASSEPTVATARRHGLGVSVVAPVAGIVTVVLLVGAGADVGSGFPGTVGDALVLAPLAYAIAHTLVLLAGELTWPRPAGVLRRARLVPRRLSDVVPRRLARMAAAGTAVLVAVLAVGGALATGGHEITHRDGPYTRSASPWPGWHYGRPVAVELGVLAVVVALALRVVVNRPAVATEDERIEDALRRTSAHRVLRGATSAVLVLAGALLAVTGNALGSVQALPWPGAIALDLLGDAGMLAGLVVLCLPAPRLPVEAPAVRAG